DGYRRFSQHQVELLTLPAQFWKWRMQGGAITIRRLLDKIDALPDFLLVSGMINLATLRALLTRQWRTIPTVIYFHETQLTYPQNSRQAHGWQYGFINYISALAADYAFFNSTYHLKIFLETLPNMLKHFGDYNELQTVDEIRKKSAVLPLGLNLGRFDPYRPVRKPENRPSLILWNHRWEEDKNPQAFFEALHRLKQRDIPFQVVITGENVRKQPVEFEEARKRLRKEIVHYGYLQEFAAYARLLWQADIAVSTATQDFFGGSIAEAIYCECVPVLPDRLNYPDLLTPDARPHFLYRGKTPFHRLRQCLESKTHLQFDLEALRSHISQFDWRVIAPLYDSVFEAIYHGNTPFALLK
ncbi:MAG: tRNA-queuosine alpha-mannosyltransferase domain-containing protein, partial [Chloroflexota bacterium]